MVVFSRVIKAGIIPGILLTLLFMFYIGVSKLNKSDADAGVEKIPFRDKVRTLSAVVPPSLWPAWMAI